jgi:hypothetical protein
MLALPDSSVLPSPLLMLLHHKVLLINLEQVIYMSRKGSTSVPEGRSETAVSRVQSMMAVKEHLL